ncbi:hypothetical protein F5X96DRAFT_530586 [Biscogniauxia mediterranea]|nr:hypothetical protein F5X96DRAFT_530586 [Biscogniauxia mediterranea]
MPTSYRIEISPNNRAGCQDKVCKDNGQKITKGELRFGTWVTMPGTEHGSWKWRHWGCVSGKTVGNLQAAIESGGEYDWDMIDGYEDITDDDIKEKIQRVITQGHIDAEDFKGDPEFNVPGKVAIRARPKKAKAGAADDEDDDEAPAPKKAAKRGRKKVEDDDEEEEEEEKPAKKKAKAGRKSKGSVVEEEEEEEKPAKKKAKAGRKSKGSVVEDEEEIVQPAKKTKGGRKSKKIIEEDEEEEPAPKKAKGGRKPKAASAPPPKATKGKRGRPKKT